MMGRPSKKAKEREGYNSTAGMFWVEDPLTEKEYSQARRNGVNYKTAYTRRHTLGWSKHDTINEPVQVNESEESKIREKYRDRRIAAGITVWKFNQRVFKEGIDPEVLLSDSKLQENKKGRKASVHIITDEQYAIAASNGISRRQLQNRLAMNGKNFPIERAITEPIGTHPSARRYAK